MWLNQAMDSHMRYVANGRQECKDAEAVVYVSMAGRSNTARSAEAAAYKEHGSEEEMQGVQECLSMERETNSQFQG
jgi:hypothetical protein